MSFGDFERFDDIMSTHDFEGMRDAITFSESEMQEIVAGEDAGLVDSFDKKGRMLYVTQQTNFLMRDLKAHVSGSKDAPKFRILSAHDTNIANWLTQLVPKLNWRGIPYASSIQILLHQDSRTKKFFVSFLYNGHKVKFGCKHVDKYICEKDEFFRLLRQRTLSNSDLVKACAAEPLFRYYP